MSDFMNILCCCGDDGGYLTISKRFTGSYIVTTPTSGDPELFEGLVDVLFEGNRSQCFSFISERLMKFHENHSS